MKLYTELVKELTPLVTEIFPWDLNDILENEGETRDETKTMILDVREPYEFEKMHKQEMKLKL